MQNTTDNNWQRIGENTDPMLAANYLEDANKSICLLYTSPSPRDNTGSRMPSSA